MIERLVLLGATGDLAGRFLLPALAAPLVRMIGQFSSPLLARRPKQDPRTTHPGDDESLQRAHAHEEDEARSSRTGSRMAGTDSRWRQSHERRRQSATDEDAR